VELYPSKKQFEKDPVSNILLESLLQLEVELGLQQALVYHNFPLYRDDEGGLIVSDTMLLSPHLGVIPIALTAAKDTKDQMGLPRSLTRLEQVPKVDPIVKTKKVPSITWSMG
jgi:hypothetical protein